MEQDGRSRARVGHGLIPWPQRGGHGAPSGGDNSFNDMNGKLPGKIATILGLLIVSRWEPTFRSLASTAPPLPSLCKAVAASSIRRHATGGSISKLGIFSLGIDAAHQLYHLPGEPSRPPRRFPPAPR